MALLTTLLLFAVALTPQLAAADEGDSKRVSRGWTDVAKGERIEPASSKDFVPMLSEEEAYIERYTISLDLDGGGWIGAYFTISNLGFGNGHGAARLKIKLPHRMKDAAKGQYTFFKKVARDEWSYDEEELDLSIAGLRLEAKQDGSGFTIRFEEPDGSVKLELDVSNDLPMWKPGRGRIDVADGGYLVYGLLSPRGSAKGRVFIDGAWHDISSTRQVFADHSATNVAPFDLGSHFAHCRTYKDDVMVAWRSLKLGEEYGGQTYTWMMVGYKDDIVFSDADATIKTGDTKRDGKTGYTIPYSVQLEGEQPATGSRKKGGKEKTDRVKLIMKGERMWKEDLLDRYGAAAKLVAGAVSKPFRYEFASKFAATLEIGGARARVGGEGRYYFDFMKP